MEDRALKRYQIIFITTIPFFILNMLNAPFVTRWFWVQYFILRYPFCHSIVKNFFKVAFRRPSLFPFMSLNVHLIFQFFQ